MNIFLANVIYILHILLILFIIIIPFLDIPLLIILHIVLCIGLIFHWIFNSDVCFLTIVETHLRGVKYDKTFTYKLVSPVYNISQYSYNKIIWIFTIILLLISIYKLYKSSKFKTFLHKIKYTNTYSKIFYIECAKLLTN